MLAAESRLDGRVPPLFGAASGGPCARSQPGARLIFAQDNLQVSCKFLLTRSRGYRYAELLISD